MKYLDTNVIIYAIENNSKYGNKCKNILEQIQNKKLEVCCSIMVLIEILNVLNKINHIFEKENKEILKIEDNIDAILNLPIVWYDLNFLIIKHASKYDFKISTMDFIHVATMELNSTFEIISADSDFYKISFIKRIDPLEFKI